MNNLAEKLLKLRKHYNYSQRFIAEILGIDVLEYMGFENGRAVINFSQAKKLAKFYHISVAELFNNELEVSLYDISNTNTDELNIEYFLPSPSKKELVLNYLKKYKYYIASTLVFVMIVLTFIFNSGGETVSNLSLKLENINRLAASDTSVVYIDDNGVVKGNGDNTNGQLNLNFNDIIKVQEGMTFTVVLDSNGNLDSSGLMSKHAQEIKKWKNIIDFACGDGHIVALDNSGNVYCTGDNVYGQCEFKNTTNIKKVFATSRGTILVNGDGELLPSGEFFGRSSIKNHKNIIDIDSSDTLLVLLNQKGRVDYYSNGKNYNEVAFFENIVDIACGNDFIAALDSNGKVFIDIDNYLIKEEVEKWEGIIAIASGDDYLVGYDGNTIKGVGKNTYKQFDSSDEQVQYRLPQVRNIKIVADLNYVTVQFDEVPNAKAYLVEVDVGTGFSAYIQDPICLIDVSKFEDGRTYNVSITAMGEGEYSDSLYVLESFTYHKVDNGSDNEDPNDIIVIDIPFALDQLVGKTKTNFEIYLSGLGISQDQLTAIESDNLCSGSEAIIESVEGLSEYEIVTKPELKNRKITYKYCKVGE